MANYKQTDATGTAWQRGYAISINNKLGEIPKITFYEEEVINFNGKILANHIGQIEEYLIDPNRTFDIYNPMTDEKLPVTATYQEIYVMLYSLYNTLARARDTAIELANAPPQTDVPPNDPPVEDPPLEGTP